MPVERTVEIPGMRVTIQGPISPDGQTLAFELPVDEAMAINQAALDERLDVLTSATRRQRAIEELPLTLASLATNRQLYREEEKRRAAHIAGMNARVAQRSQGRRVEALPNPADANSLAQFDQRLAQIDGQIKLAQNRIPYLRALIAREEPPELYPEEDAATLAAE